MDLVRALRQSKLQKLEVQLVMSDKVKGANIKSKNHQPTHFTNQGHYQVKPQTRNIDNVTRMGIFAEEIRQFTSDKNTQKSRKRLNRDHLPTMRAAAAAREHYIKQFQPHSSTPTTPKPTWSPSTISNHH